MEGRQLVATMRRRPLAMVAGQQLFLPDSALQTVNRAMQFLDFANLSPEDVLTTPLMAMPLPMTARIPAG